MAISSPLNPGVIAPERRVTPQKVQNFISGGAPLGSTVVASAANKIVGFQRGAAAVAPQAPDLGSIIKTLSSNILTNVENRIQSINQNVNQFVTERLGDLGKSFREKVNKIDAATPNKILENFLGLYRNAIDYIRFFANPNNVKNLANNLESLQKVFAETFDVATKIRRTIIRIVDQLSTLPTASAGGSGLNLDVNVPGGGLKKSAPRGLMRAMRRRPGMMLGGAALAGGGAALATSALAKVGQDVEAVPTETGGGLSGPMLDKFNEILDRFSRAINSLANTKPQQKQSSSSSGSSSKASPPPKDEKQPGGTPSAGAAAVSSAPGDEKLAAFVATMEASSPENAADAMQVMLNRSASGKYGKGLAGVLSGYDQFSPISAAIFGDSEDKNAKRVYGPIAAKLPGKTPQEKFQYLQQVAAEPDGLNKLQQIFGGGSANVAATLLNDPKYLAASRQNVKNAQNFYGGKQYNPSDVQFRPGGNWFYNFTGPIGKLGSQPTGTTTTPQIKPTVAAAPTPAATQQQVAQQVSQPVIPVSSAPQVTVVPIGGQQGSQQPVVAGGGGGGKRSMPFLPSGNSDNFLTLYSRIVYNIVDG